MSLGSAEKVAWAIEFSRISLMLWSSGSESAVASLAATAAAAAIEVMFDFCSANERNAKSRSHPPSVWHASEIPGEKSTPGGQ